MGAGDGRRVGHRALLRPAAGSAGLPAGDRGRQPRTARSRGGRDTECPAGRAKSSRGKTGGRGRVGSRERTGNYGRTGSYGIRKRKRGGGARTGGRDCPGYGGTRGRDGRERGVRSRQYGTKRRQRKGRRQQENGSHDARRAGDCDRSGAGRGGTGAVRPHGSRGSGSTW